MRHVSYDNQPPLLDLQAEAKIAPFEKIPDGAGEARGVHSKPGWIHGLQIARLYGPGIPDIMLDNYPTIGTLVHYHAAQEKRSIKQVMLNVLEPGAVLEKHRDGAPMHYRWHFPLHTNKQVMWWDEIGGPVHMAAYEWWGPVNYCGILHSMTNPSLFPRMHLIVDLL